MERLKFTTAVVLYGTIGVFLRYVSLPSEFVAMCRGSIGAIFILIYMLIRHRHLDYKAIRANLLLLIISGVSLGLNWIFLFSAYTQTTVAIASLCNYMAPVIVIIIAPLLLKEVLNKKKLFLVALAIIGIFFISIVPNRSVVNISGVFLGLLAALFFVIIVICNRKLSGIDPLERALVQLVISALTILPYFLIHNQGVKLDFDFKSVIIIIMLGALHTGFAYCLYFSGMAKLPVQSVAVLGYLEPVVSVLCSVFLLNEKMTLLGWIGSVLIVVSALLSEILPSGRSEKSVE